MKENLKLQETANECLKKIWNEFSDFVMIELAKELVKYAKGTYLEKHLIKLITILSGVYVNPKTNWFMIKWAALGNMKDKDAIIHEKCDSTRLLGLLQGISISFSSFIGSNDIWWQPIDENENKDSPLKQIMSYIFNTFDNVAFEKFDQLFSVEMKKAKISRKDLFSLYKSKI